MQTLPRPNETAFALDSPEPIIGAALNEKFDAAWFWLSARNSLRSRAAFVRKL